MAISWHEIKDRALGFSKEWQHDKNEDAEAKSFWDGFFNVFGISRRRVATFEEPVKKRDNKQGYVDLLWKGVILVEHKSRGKDLDRAYTQAKDYFAGLTEAELPQYVLVSDFARFRLYNLEENTVHEFALKDLHQHVKLFGFIAGYQTKTYKEEDPVNVEAAELMGRLHDKLREVGYVGHELEVYLVRLLFCLFADDTAIFERGIFRDYLDQKTREDGSDLAAHLGQLFAVLNTPPEKRLRNLDESLAAFPYVNGKLFEEHLPFAAFDSAMRRMLLECSGLNWGKISPAIFGSLFQCVMNPTERRNLGAHYTSEKNILKLIKPLFLDALWKEFEGIKHKKADLTRFHQKLATLRFLDPACGCGNFLIIAYRELRLLEMEVIKALQKGQMVFDVKDLIRVNVDQFYGIEYEEWPARISEVALWLMDHQMNLLVSEEFGFYYARLPLRKSASITHGNALRINWEELISKENLAFILGNPPFIGHHNQSAEQKTDMKLVFNGAEGAGVLDYVSAWYIKAAQFITGTSIRVGFVSTNSIAQGEQVGILWNQLINRYRVKIHFAHRTFKWRNEARGIAAVHCIIVGFALDDTNEKYIYDYENVNGEPLEIRAKNINPYLVDGKDVLIRNRTEPINKTPRMVWGNKPTDGGSFLFNTELEKNDFVKLEPNAAPWIRPYMGGEDLINSKNRYCLWLVNISASELKNLPHTLKRVAQVKKMREESKAEATRRKAMTPTLFAQIAQPKSNYLAIPEVSSEKRAYIPIAFLTPDVIASNTVQLVPSATLFHFGILTSSMHMAWVKYTCGRLKSDYRYSNSIVYNNFPWPQSPSEKQIRALEVAAQKVLDARASFPGDSLADLYDPVAMPPLLAKAHQDLDKAVDLCYRPQPFPSELKRIEYLFELYDQYTTPLAAAVTDKKVKKRGKAEV